MNRDDNGKILPGRIHFEFQIRGSILPKRFSGVAKTSIPAFNETQLPEKVTYSAVPVYSSAYVLCADVVIRDGVIEPGKLVISHQIPIQISGDVARFSLSSNGIVEEM